MTLSHSLAISFNARATLERRVAPLAATLLLWVALIDAVRLVAHAL
ncbi:hypothetical protein [Caulobacter sp.]|jgi:hypothetical protein